MKIRSHILAKLLCSFLFTTAFGVLAQPLVSVVVPVRQESDNLAACLNDLLQQTIKDQVEIIVLSTCSHDAFRNTLLSFQDRYAKAQYLPISYNMNVSALWNVGCVRAQGKYIIVSQVNDRYHPQAFDQLANELEKNADADIVYADMYHTNQLLEKFDSTLGLFHTDLPESAPHWLEQASLGCCAMWRSTLQRQFGYFRQDLSVFGQWEFFNRVAFRGARSRKYCAIPAVHCDQAIDANDSTGKSEYNQIQQQYQSFWKCSETILPEKPIVVVVPSFNNMSRCKKNLDSIFAQKYTNYRIVYLDDASTDGNGEFVEQYVKECGQSHRVTIVHNKERLGAGANKYKGAQLCNDWEIYVDLDGDDEMAHAYVLDHLNRVYANPDIWVTYGQFIYWPSGFPGWAAQLDPSIVERNAVRDENWVTTAMRTFYAGLFKRIKADDLMLDGKWVMMASDLAFMFCIMEMGGKHSAFIPEVLYVYDFGGNHNDQVNDGRRQNETGWRLRTKKRYQPVNHYVSKSRKNIYITPGWTIDLFAVNNPVFNRDNCLQRFCCMRDGLQEQGYDVQQVTRSQSYSDDGVGLICFDVVSEQDMAAIQKCPYEKRILFLWEPPSVFAHCYDTKLHNLFSKIYTWADDLVDNKRYFKFYYPVLQPMIERVIDFDQKQFCTMIACNKNSGHPNQLYSERRAIIDFFEKHYPTDFDLYGRDWDCSEYETYKGTISCKLDYLKHYKFCICYENLKDMNGYVTEKLFDAFQAGVVPVYWGAPNVTQYVPKNCFIDRRDFVSNEQLYQFLKSITRQEYEQYLKNIQQFLSSEAARPFSIEYFVSLMNTVVTGIDAQAEVKAPQQQMDKFYFVTAANSGYFEPLLNLIASLHKTNYERTGQIAVFDLGLTDHHKEVLRKIEKVEIYTVEMAHPDVLTPITTTPWGKKVPGAYAWKPVIIKQALDMFPTILYIDAGTTVYRPLDDLFDHITKNGYFLHDGSPWYVGRMTTNYVRKKFDLDAQSRKWILDERTFGLEAGFMGLTRAAYSNFVKPMYEIVKNDFQAFIDDGTCLGGFGNSRHDLTLFSIVALLNGMHIYHHFEKPLEDLYLDTSTGKKPFHIACNPQDRTPNTHIYASRLNINLQHFGQFIRLRK